MLTLWWNNGRSSATARKSAARNTNESAGQPDNRLVFAVLAVGMIVGALLLGPAKPSATPVLKAPGSSAK